MVFGFSGKSKGKEKDPEKERRRKEAAANAAATAAAVKASASGSGKGNGSATSASNAGAKSDRSKVISEQLQASAATLQTDNKEATAGAGTATTSKNGTSAEPLKSSLKNTITNTATSTGTTTARTPAAVVTPTSSPSGPRDGANVRSSTPATATSTPKFRPRSGPIDVDDLPRTPSVRTGLGSEFTGFSDSTQKTKTTTGGGAGATTSNFSVIEPSEYSNSTQRSKTTTGDATANTAMTTTSNIIANSSNSNSNNNKGRPPTSPSKHKKRFAVDTTTETFHAMQQEQMHITTTTTTTMRHTRSAVIARNSSSNNNYHEMQEPDVGKYYNNNNNNNNSNGLENTSIVSLKSDGQGGGLSPLRRSNSRGGGADDASMVSSSSWGTGSLVSRISIQIDHFLAEMAVADNAKLEQLAIQEMKHQQILPQKIKKLSAKINVLTEERQVLVGLIEQLSELVEQDKERKRAARKKKKKLKREKKRQKRHMQKKQQQKLLLLEQQKLDQEKATATAQDDTAAIVTPERANKDRSSSPSPSTASSTSPLVGDKNDSDADLSYLEDIEAKIAQAKGLQDNNTVPKEKQTQQVKNDDDEQVESPWYDKDEDEDDEFAKLWNASYNTDGGSDHPTAAPAASATSPVSAEPKILFDVGDPLSDPMFDDFYNNENDNGEEKLDDKEANDKSNSYGEEEEPTAAQGSTKEKEEEEVAPASGTAPASYTSQSRRESKPFETKRIRREAPTKRLPKRTKSFEDKYKAFQNIQGELEVSDGEENETKVVGSEAGASAGADTEAQAKKEDAGAEVHSKKEDAADGNRQEKDDGSHELVFNATSFDTSTLQTDSTEYADRPNDTQVLGQDMGDESGHIKSSVARKQRFGRFSAYQETDTYLPEHMPGSRGNSPTPSMEKVAGQSSSDLSDSDSSSDSDDSSLGDDDNEDRVIVDDHENEAVPSGSHLLAKQLMSRLKHEEKQKEQEKLQRQLYELHSNSKHRQREESLPSSFHGKTNYAGASSFAYSERPGIAGNKSASMTNVYLSNRGQPSLASGAYVSNSFKAHRGGRPTNSMLENYRQDSHISTGKSFADEDSFSRLHSSFQTGGVTEEVNTLRQELVDCIQELDQLKEERLFHEAKVKQLLGALERRFDMDGDEEDDDDDDADDDDADGTADAEIQKAMAEESIDEQAFTAGKKRKRIQFFLLQKVSECAELAAEVEVLKKQVNAKQNKLGGAKSGQFGSDHSSNERDKAVDESIPKPVASESVVSISADLTRDQVEKQLLEKSGECIDLREQIKELKNTLTEKDEAYQEVHRELFTANLALGVEVDRKATAQEALDEKQHEYEMLKTEYDEIKARLDKYDEKAGTLDDELLAKNSMIDEMDRSHRDEVSLIKSQMEEKDNEISKLEKELLELREKAKRLEEENHELDDKASTQENLVEEFKKNLDVENDLRLEAEKKSGDLEKEVEVLKDDLARAKHENEINKSLIEYKESSSGGNSIDRAEIHEKVEKLMAENAEMSRELRTMREAENSLNSERERLVANATNMSIMLADSRAKVDFLQMQLEEYKNPTSQSEHGFPSTTTEPLSRSAHGFTGSAGNKAADFRNFLSNKSAKIGNQITSMNGNQAMGDSSERSAGGLGSSVRERNTRFRNFLSRRMGSQKDEPAGADSAAGGKREVDTET